MRTARVAWPFLLVLVSLALVNAPAYGSIVLDEQYPEQDKPARIQVTDSDGNLVPGASVAVTYRPGSKVSKTAEVGRTADDGAVEWTPQDAGIATITASWTGSGEATVTASRTVSVRFSSPPMEGILIMIVAGVLLIVGSIVRIYKLLRAPEAP
jgi:hypothetical protein